MLSHSMGRPNASISVVVRSKASGKSLEAELDLARCHGEEGLPTNDP